MGEHPRWPSTFVPWATLLLTVLMLVAAHSAPAAEYWVEPGNGQ